MTKFAMGIMASVLIAAGIFVGMESGWYEELRGLQVPAYIVALQILMFLVGCWCGAYLKD